MPHEGVPHKPDGCFRILSGGGFIITLDKAAQVRHHQHKGAIGMEYPVRLFECLAEILEGEVFQNVGTVNACCTAFSNSRQTVYYVTIPDSARPAGAHYAPSRGNR
jgi:hypothetical protein